MGEQEQTAFVLVIDTVRDVCSKFGKWIFGIKPECFKCTANLGELRFDVFFDITGPGELPETFQTDQRVEIWRNDKRVFLAECLGGVAHTLDHVNFYGSEAGNFNVVEYSHGMWELHVLGMYRALNNNAPVIFH